MPVPARPIDEGRALLLPWCTLVLLPGEVVDAVTLGSCGLKPIRMMVRVDRIQLDPAEVETLVPITHHHWSGTLGRTGVGLKDPYADLPHGPATAEDKESLRVVSMHAQSHRFGCHDVNPLLQDLLPTASHTLEPDGAKAINPHVLRELFDEHEPLEPGAKLTMRLHNTGGAPLGVRAMLVALGVR